MHVHGSSCDTPCHSRAATALHLFFWALHHVSSLGQTLSTASHPVARQRSVSIADAACTGCLITIPLSAPFASTLHLHEGVVVHVTEFIKVPQLLGVGEGVGAGVGTTLPSTA
eukprot:2810233-Amphidinium_carterae.2